MVIAAQKRRHLIAFQVAPLGIAHSVIEVSKNHFCNGILTSVIQLIHGIINREDI
jgi:hypothetical protein